MMQDQAPARSPRPFAVTHRLVLSIALPMMLAYLTTPLLGLVDTAVVGRMGDAALLGGLAAGAIVFDLVYGSFNFLRLGTTALVAQAYGREDPLEEQAVFWRAFAIALVVGLALALSGPLFAAGGVWFIAGEAPVGEALTVYVVIRFLSSPAALANYAILGYVLGRGEAGLGLLLQILINGVNIAMSIYLGLVLGWGLEGVAWGTVIGEGVGAVAGMAVVGVRFARAARVPAARLRDFDAFRRMTVVNRDIMIRTFVLVAAYALFTRQGAQLGTETLAANAVLINFLLVAGYFLDGYASAAEQLAGRAVGASWRPAFDRMLRLTALWGFATSGVLCLFFLVAGEALIGIITTAPEVREAAMRYLPWAAAAAVTGVLAFQMDGVFIGATWSRDMRNTMLVSLAVYCVALLLLEPVWGNHGLWAAFHVFLLVRGFTMLAVVPPRARETFGT